MAASSTLKVLCGHASAVTVLARLGSAARGDPLYDAGVQLGKLLRTAFFTDYFVNEAFRRELRRVLNRGEAINALKRAIYSGRVAKPTPNTTSVPGSWSPTRRPTLRGRAASSWLFAAQR